MAAFDAVALEAGEQRSSQPRRSRQRSGRGKAALLLAAAGLAVSSWGLGDAESAQAAALPELKKEKVLFTGQGYELKVMPRKTKSPLKAIPKVVFQKIPAQMLKFVGASGSVESDLGKDIAGFPFTTANKGSVAMGFPRVGGVVKLSMEDPPLSADEDAAAGAAEVSYDQTIKGVGQVGARVSSKGDWVATWNRKVEDVGNLRTTLNYQLDWTADLDTAYPAYKGVKPTISYGATQDGMRVKAKVEGAPVANTYGSYQVQNEAGKYAPRDFVHDARLVYTAGANSVQADGKYDRSLPNRPYRGSLSYVVRAAPASLTASVDFDRYRLKASTDKVTLSAAVATKAGDGSGLLGGRTAELGVKMGPVAAEAVLKGSKKPRVRLQVGA